MNPKIGLYTTTIKIEIGKFPFEKHYISVIINVNIFQNKKINSKMCQISEIDAKKFRYKNFEQSFLDHCC